MKRLIAPAIIVVALVCFAILLLSTAGHKPSIQTLPDGSLLKLVSVSYSTNHSYHGALTMVTGWRKAIARILPKTSLARLGWTMTGGPSMTVFGLGEGSSNLAVFTYCQEATNSSFLYTRVQVFDDLGNTFDDGGARGTLDMRDNRQSIRVDCWNLSAFPRRSATVGLRYFLSSGRNKPWSQVAEFSIPNPAPGKYPNWSPEPTPATKTDGGLTVTLQSLTSGLSKIDPTRPVATNEVAVTEAVLHVTQTGRTNHSWRPKEVQTSDATGNKWKPLPYQVKTTHTDDSDTFTFDGALWPGESAWKLRFEFSRDDEYDPDEICAFSGIIVPGASQVIMLGDSTNVAGSELRLVAISGETAEQPGNLKWSTARKHTNLSIRVEPLPSDRRLTLVRITDETGREATIRRQPDYRSPEQVYAFKVPEGAKQLTATFALHKSCFVEFLARPKFPLTGPAAAK
jgi:hypothetical protein